MANTIQPSSMTIPIFIEETMIFGALEGGY